jgi:hypothetical protein
MNCKLTHFITGLVDHHVMHTIPALAIRQRNETSPQIIQGNGRATGREEVRVIGIQHLCHEE